MGLKVKILVGVAEIAAMLLIKIYATKLIQKVRPAGARVRRFPDGTPVVRYEEPAYYNESPQGEEQNAAYLSGGGSTPDKGLREKARRLLRRWQLSWRNKFHKPHRADQWPPRVLQRFEEARNRGELPPYEFTLTTDYEREPPKAE